MLESLDHEGGYSNISTVVELGRPFKPGKTSAGYLHWPRLPEIFPISYPGVKTSRDGALVDIDRATLEVRMRHYFDAAVPDVTIAKELSELMANSKRFNAAATRKALLSRGIASGRIVRYCYRPFDVR